MTLPQGAGIPGNGMKGWLTMGSNSGIGGGGGSMQIGASGMSQQGWARSSEEEMGNPHSV